MTSPAGWYPDPRDPSRDRYWDGEQWTPQTRKRQSEGFVKAYRRLPPWAQWGIPIVAVLLVIGAIAGDEDSDQEASNPQQAEQVDRLREKLEQQRATVRAERQRARQAIRARRAARARARRVARARARHTREAAAAKTAAEARAVEESAQESSSECDPNYSGCVPAYPPDVDCAELGESVAVYGSDPHGLDADADGTGCE